MTGGTVGTYGPAVSKNPKFTDNQFRFIKNPRLYNFNLATAGLNAGTYSLRISLVDGTTHTARFSLR